MSPSWSVRPGVYYGMSYDKTGKELFTATVIPNRGAWLEYETDSNDVFYVRIDKNRKLPGHGRCCVRWACATDARDPASSSAMTSRINATLEKDITAQAPRRACSRSTASCAPASRPTVESAQRASEQPVL